MPNFKIISEDEDKIIISTEVAYDDEILRVVRYRLPFIKIKDHASDKTIPNLSLKGLEECDFVAGLSLNELINLQCDATAMALVQEGISVDTITLERLDEFHAGWLIFYYELLTSATGIMLGINTYDQPGVEIGKRILKTMLLK